MSSFVSNDEGDITHILLISFTMSSREPSRYQIYRSTVLWGYSDFVVIRIFTCVTLHQTP